MTPYNNIISFIDADDIPSPNKLQYVEDFFNSPASYMDDGVALVHSFQTNNESFSEDPMTGMVRYEPCEINPTCTNLQVKSNSPIHHGHVSVKKKFLSPTNITLTTIEVRTGYSFKK